MEILLATKLNWIGIPIYNWLYKWVATFVPANEYIGAFAVAVIFFTVFLKILTLPLDIWQKAVTRVNQKKQTLMQPEIERVQKQCGDDKQLFQQKQREIQKKYGYKVFQACLPAIVSMAIFITVFSGYNSAVRHHNSVVYDKLRAVYNKTYQEEMIALGTPSILDTDTPKEKDEKSTLIIKNSEKASAKASEAVVKVYSPEKFLWITNIFMPDNWKTPIPDVGTFAGTGLGNLGIKEGINPEEYEKIMKPIMEKYNVNKKGKNKWNGYLVLPILVIALGIIQAKFMTPAAPPALGGTPKTEEEKTAADKQNKMMQMLMPLMMGVFSLFYSAAFTLYMLINTLFTFLVNVIYNVITKAKDKKELDYIMSTTVKKRR